MTNERNGIPIEFTEWAKANAEKDYEDSHYQKPLGKTMWMEAAEKMAEKTYQKLISPDQPGIDREGGMPERIHINLPSGGMATVSPNASPELLGALDKMVELAKKMPDKSGSAENAQGEIPKEIKQWIGQQEDQFPLGSAEQFGCRVGLVAMYHKLQEDWKPILIAGKLYDAEKEIEALQASLSSIKAERDETFKEYEDLLQERDRIRLVSHDARKDRDFFKKESESYHKAWKEATAIIEGKNLEIAEMKEALGKIQTWLYGGQNDLAIVLLRRILNPKK